MNRIENDPLWRANMAAATLASIVLMPLLVAGCSGGSSSRNSNGADGNGDNDIPVFTTAVNGRWRTACHQRLNGSDFNINTLIIDTGTFVRTLDTFLDGSCEFQIQRQTGAGTFLETGSTEVEGRGTATHVDFTSTELGMALFTEADLARVNSTSLCGATWTEGTLVDVSNCSGINNSTVPNTAFTLFLLENDELFLAEVVTTVEERPTTLDEFPHLPVE